MTASVLAAAARTEPRPDRKGSRSRWARLPDGLLDVPWAQAKAYEPVTEWLRGLE